MASAAVQGQLWGMRAREFAIYLEQVVLPLYGAALDAAGVTFGTRLLDAGCGAGLLALLASLRGARVSALAGANEVLVSSTLRDLVIGSGLEFEERGAHQLKGVPGEWQIFAVAS